MAYTKIISRHDKITIDGTDVSNSFSEFGLTSEYATEDASGFSVSGVDETLPGGRSMGFNGTAFYTEELAALVWPIHNGAEIVPITWQPNGLVDATREIYIGNCTINTFNPTDTRGSVSTWAFSATSADEDGITATDFT